MDLLLPRHFYLCRSALKLLIFLLLSSDCITKPLTRLSGDTDTVPPTHEHDYYYCIGTVDSLRWPPRQIRQVCVVHSLMAQPWDILMLSVNTIKWPVVVGGQLWSRRISDGRSWLQANGCGRRG